MKKILNTETRFFQYQFFKKYQIFNTIDNFGGAISNIFRNVVNILLENDSKLPTENFKSIFFLTRR